MKTLLLMIITFVAYPVLANSISYSTDYIRGEGDVEGIKLAVQYHSDALSSYSEHLGFYVESGINFWEYGEPERRDTTFVLSFSPVVQYSVATLTYATLYVEAGIGVSLLDDTRFAGKDVSTHFQFEDRFGLVVRFGQRKKHQLALRYFHYSNAGIKKPNPGLDFIALSYMYYF